jgi:hypothetical protein
MYVFLLPLPPDDRILAGLGVLICISENVMYPAFVLNVKYSVQLGTIFVMNHTCGLAANNFIKINIFPFMF